VSAAAPPLRLLIVEDDRDAAEELAELLGAWGFAARIAATPDAARAEAAHWQPGAALIDLELGGHSGLGIALQWHGEAGAPRVVLLSGRSLTQGEKALFKGAEPPLLGKPLDIRRLLDELSNDGGGDA